jgi:hypothetical protein
MHEYPKKFCLFTLNDGTKIYETVTSEKEYNILCRQIEEAQEYVRNYFAQYCP